ncbi:hypothetical protein MESS2_1140041 [Mesorhizobium metallidurans STM 2683]|uniref:Uncharacterized protein n=1 Tax=Mesorhizobium metallidurans STM 2683 TaxID=1297569 RepID=M5EW59_9HYPH|nr:hypothetical protein MESS2_1140041 [Mesorhizobium metallidurans STM 2683]
MRIGSEMLLLFVTKSLRFSTLFRPRLQSDSAINHSGIGEYGMLAAGPAARRLEYHSAPAET